MLDIKYIRENAEKIKEAARVKNIKIDINRLLEIDEKRKVLIQKSDELRAQKNEISGQTKGEKPSPELIKKSKTIKEALAEIEENLNPLEKEYVDLMYRVPLVPSKDTPIGKDDSENVEIKRWSPEKGDGGDPKEFNFKFKDHIRLGEEMNLLDIERGAKTGGFRAYYLKNEAVFLHMGLMMLGLDLIQSKGFEPFIPPTIVKKEALLGSGHFPFDEESVYVINTLGHTDGDIKMEGKDKKFLVGTAEPSILNYYRGETLAEKDLPKKMCGFSQCYRGEIGSYGKDTKGLYRIHEFMKIEQVVFCKNDYNESTKIQNDMISYSEELLQLLKLPYRVIQVCTGDMGAGKYRMFDIETWMPSRNAYGETHSASNLGDWQSRRLNIKIKSKNGETYYPHALNNTVIASPRILIAILENYQQEDGSIIVPEVLRKYLPGNQEVIKTKNYGNSN